MADWLTKEQRRRNMSSIKSMGTKTEERLDQLLEEIFGRRIRRIPQPGGIPGRPDWLVPRLALIVFADGCFWHGCRQHGRVPEDNNEYWSDKLRRNRERDRRVSRELRDQGYTVVRVWDHDLQGSMSRARYKIRRAIRAIEEGR